MSHIIRRLRERHGLTQRELAAALGVSDKAVSTWEKGEKTPRRATLLRLAAVLDVPVGALLENPTPRSSFGDTLERLLSSRNHTPASLADAAGIRRSRMTRLLGGGEPTADELARLEGVLKLSLQGPLPESNLHPLTAVPRRRIAVLGRVPAGVPLEAVTDVVAHIDLTEDDGYDYFALQVRGNSMYPEYRDGDVVVVRAQSTADTGEDVVAYVGDADATLKRLHRTAEGIELRPINPDYPILRFTSDEIRHLPVTLAGVVVEQRRRRR
jgi:repressor LexA